MTSVTFLFLLTDQSLPSAVEPHAVDVSFDTSDAFPEHVKVSTFPGHFLSSV